VTNKFEAAQNASENNHQHHQCSLSGAFKTIFEKKSLARGKYISCAGISFGKI